MNNYEITLAISEKLNISLLEARNLLNALLDVIKDELINNRNVKIKDFGNFRVVHRAARKGYNPYYKKTTIIPPCLEPVFIPGKKFKEIIVNEAVVD